MVWGIPMSPPKTSEERFAERAGEYPHQVIMVGDGPNPKLVAGNMPVDLIYIKRGEERTYAFRTEKDAERFRARYGLAAP